MEEICAPVYGGSAYMAKEYKKTQKNCHLDYIDTFLLEQKMLDQHWQVFHAGPDIINTSKVVY